MINGIWGDFAGTDKLVAVWNNDAGELLAETTLSSDGQWNYVEIAPVAVQANTNYVVAVILNSGDQETHRNLTDPLPKTFGNIEIVKSFFGSSSVYNTLPLDFNTVNTQTMMMCGQIDISFVADE